MIYCMLPETNKSPLKNGDGEMILTFWVLAHVQGQAVSCREGKLS